MKKLKEILSNILKTIFGYGIFICLFVGGLTFFGYLVALIAGGNTAVVICDFIYNTIFKHLITLSSTLVILGLLKMYLCGEVALSNKKK